MHNPSVYALPHTLNMQHRCYWFQKEVSKWINKDEQRHSDIVEHFQVLEQSWAQLEIIFAPLVVANCSFTSRLSSLRLLPPQHLWMLP